MVLDQPTRDGDTEIHLLTNVPAQDAHAHVIADLYRKRWTIETAFAELEATLEGEVNTLGYPKSGAVRLLRGLGVVQRAEHAQGGATDGAR